MPLADLTPALDTFLEAGSAVTARRRKHRLLAPIIASLEAAIARAFRAQGRAFMRRFARLKGKFPILEEAIGERDWLPFFTAAELETIRAFTDPMDRFVARAMAAGGKAATALLGNVGAGISFDLKNPRAVAFLRRYGADRVTMINDTTRSILKSIVTEAVESGWSYDRTAEAIISRFAEFAVGKPQLHIDSRAHLVAVTESANAYEASHRVVVDDLMDGGLAIQASWLTVGDDRVSDECRANQDQGWIPASEEFQSGHAHPPRFPGCRCCALYRRKPK